MFALWEIEMTHNAVKDSKLENHGGMSDIKTIVAHVPAENVSVKWISFSRFLQSLFFSRIQMGPISISFRG